MVAPGRRALPSEDETYRLPQGSLRSSAFDAHRALDTTFRHESGKHFLCRQATTPYDEGRMRKVSVTALALVSVSAWRASAVAPVYAFSEWLKEANEREAQEVVKRHEAEAGSAR